MKILMTFFLFCNAFANDGTIAFYKGKVQVNGKDIVEKTSVSYGDEVTVGSKSLALVKLKPDSILKIKANSKLLLEKPEVKEKTVMHSYLLKFGEVFVKAKKTEKNRYQVRSKNAVMGVRGTQFFVSSEQSKKNIWMCVNEGEVAVSFSETPDKVAQVKAGEGVLIDSNELPQAKKYKWTKDLNWKFEGDFEAINDKTNIRDMGYDLESFEYD